MSVSTTRWGAFQFIDSNEHLCSTIGLPEYIPKDSCEERYLIRARFTSRRLKQEGESLNKPAHASTAGASLMDLTLVLMTGVDGLALLKGLPSVQTSESRLSAAAVSSGLEK